MQQENQSKRSFLHDLRHRALLLHNLIESNNTEIALELVAEMTEKTYPKREYVTAGHPAINAILNSHIAQAREHNINVDIADIHLPSDIELDVEDICVIFANSLENAIEANIKMPQSERWIKIALMYRDDTLVYKISNPVTVVVRNTKGLFKSTKITTGDHGIGLENIERAVDKYGGIFDAAVESDIFNLFVSISFKKAYEFAVCKY